MRTDVSWEDCDHYVFASEIALERLLGDDRAESLDEILCDPALAAEFDAVASAYAPGFTPLEYRWAALKLRKQAKLARSRGAVLVPPSRLGREMAIDELDSGQIAAQGGVYLLSGGRSRLYAGEALNLRNRLEAQFGSGPLAAWQDLPGPLVVRTFVTEAAPSQMLAWQSCLVRKYKPRLNYRELAKAR